MDCHLAGGVAAAAGAAEYSFHCTQCMVSKLLLLLLLIVVVVAVAVVVVEMEQC